MAINYPAYVTGGGSWDPDPELFARKLAYVATGLMKLHIGAVALSKWRAGRTLSATEDAVAEDLFGEEYPGAAPTDNDAEEWLHFWHNPRKRVLDQELAVLRDNPTDEELALVGLETIWS